jgi:L-glyceraldehyde 3-phosphate reductase
MGALDTAVRSGRALYAGISSYSARQTAEAAAILKSMGTPLLIHQPSYSIFNRWIENGLLDVLGREGTGCIVFSALAQGLLTGRYLGGGIPAGSRASKGGSLRGQSMAQLALSWVLRDERVTSAVIGASSVAQLEDNLGAAGHTSFSSDELAAIDSHAVQIAN